MLEGEADNAQSFSFQANNERTVKEIVKLVCGSSDKMLSRIALQTYLGYLTISRHPAHKQLVTGLNLAKCKNKSKFQEFLGDGDQLYPPS